MKVGRFECPVGNEKVEERLRMMLAILRADNLTRDEAVAGVRQVADLQADLASASRLLCLELERTL